MAPELFASLAIAHHVDDSSYPIPDHKTIIDAFKPIMPNGSFESPGVWFTTDEIQIFPTEFFPIETSVDLTTKIYLAIAQEHERRGLRRLKGAARRSEPAAVVELGRRKKH